MLVAATIMFEMAEDFFPSKSLHSVPLICKSNYLYYHSNSSSNIALLYLSVISHRSVLGVVYS